MMNAITSLLGLQPINQNGFSLQPQNHVAGYIIFHFLFAYAGLSTRPIKIYHKLDHNASPREDISKYGEDAVRRGKISRSVLNAIKRNEGAHANAVEHFPLFVAATVLATVRQVPAETINSYALGYTLVRIAYAIAYVAIESHWPSYIRSVLWWAGNIICIKLLLK